MFFVVLQNTFFFLLVRVFPDNQLKVLNNKKYIAAILYSVVTAIVAASPLLFTSFEDGAPVPGPGMALFLPHALIFAVGGIFYLFFRFFKTRGVQKAQLQYFLAGTVLLYTMVPIGNFVVPLLFKSNLFVILSPLYSIVFAGLFAYGIIAKRLFDIRAAVARSVAYILSLGFLGAVWGAVIFTIFSLLGFGNLSRESERAILVALALLTAVVFPVTKRFFDKLTNKLFYRDAYDPQIFLDQLNKTLVSDIELEVLLRNTTRVVVENLKCSSCHVAVNEANNKSIRVVGSVPSELSTNEIRGIGEELSKHRRKVIAADNLDSHQKTLQNTLGDKNISVVVSLSAGHALSDKPLAYMLLGPKKSGNIYNKQDLKIIEIIADELVIAIQNALRFEEIQGFAATLQDKVNKATAKLQQTNKKLRELDETKDEFISMASHQLRTPLTSVKGYMSMVLEEDAGKLKKQQKQLLDQAFVSSQRMVYLIADLLNVSRLKTGKFIIDAVPTNLAEVVEGEVSQLRETIRRKKLKLNYDKPKNFPLLMLDETKIRQVIMNFADNAIYYTPSGGEINISLKEDKKNVYFQVTDSGIGVPKQDKQHMFSKFYRAKNARKARPDGTGLGLFMAKKVVDAQGGSILFESEEGKGSTFGFYFNKHQLAVDKKK
jgi:signal transduction histidine kinase